MLTAGSGTREHTHNHYLKGLLWCARCKHRMVVQRTLARNGEGHYYYFFCTGRRKGLCDLPYIPVEVLEEAVVRYYGQVLATTPEGLADLRAGIDEALDSDHGLSDDVRKQFTKRLDALDKKESYFLDLAAEEGWPKDKLRSKIDAIRQEQADIRHTTERADHRLDLSRQIMYDALILLAEPQAAYARGSETVRSLLNKAFFTRLYVDGERITDHELKEPFGELMDIYEQCTTYRAAGAVLANETQTGTMPLMEHSALDREVKIGFEPLTWWVSASTKPRVVGAVEALAHRSRRVRCLLDLGKDWPDGLVEDVAHVPATYRTARQLTTAEADELVCSWEAGVGVVKLAAQFGIHRHTVWKRLRALGIDTTEKLNPAELAEASALYRSGWSLARLADRYGISDCTVRARLLEVGVVMRPRKGGKQKEIRLDELI